MKYGLIGEHLGHSYSKEIHAILGNPEYELKELAPDELGPFLQRHEFLGINVTIPYKEQVIPYLDTLSDRAAAIGAVNTIVCRNGKLIGDNTDYAGMKALLERIGIRTSPKGKALVLGTGGPSKTARAVLKDLGFGEILTVSRREGRGNSRWTVTICRRMAIFSSLTSNTRRSSAQAASISRPRSRLANSSRVGRMPVRLPQGGVTPVRAFIAW